MVTATGPRVTTPPALWQFALSHYVEKVRWALNLKRVPQVWRSLLPGLHINCIKAALHRLEVGAEHVNKR